MLCNMKVMTKFYKYSHVKEEEAKKNAGSKEGNDVAVRNGTKRKK